MRVHKALSTAILVALGALLLPAAASAELAWNEQPSQTLSTSERNAIAPQVVVDKDGNATAIWVQQEPSGNTTVNRLVTAYRPAGGYFGPPEFLSGAGESVTGPRL